MRGGKSRAATESRPGVLLGREPGPYTKNHLEAQRNCGPEVQVARRGGSVFVILANRPWGWPCPDREFFNPDAAERYANRLRGQVVGRLKKEAQRRERHFHARLDERLRELEGGAR